MQIVDIHKSNLNKLGYRDLEHWLEDSKHIYIGRSCPYVKGAKKSVYANIFSVKKYGRDKCLELYEIYARKNLMKEILKLRDKDLGCWCKGEKYGEKCHGEIIIKILNEIKNE